MVGTNSFIRYVWIHIEKWTECIWRCWRWFQYYSYAPMACQQTFCWHFTDTCWHLRKMADSCRLLLTFADSCQHMKICADTLLTLADTLLTFSSIAKCFDVSKSLNRLNRFVDWRKHAQKTVGRIIAGINSAKSVLAKLQNIKAH